MPNPITKRHACAESPLLAPSIPILLAPHADLALLQANSIKTMHPRPDPPPSRLHKTSKCTLVACLSVACLSVRLSPDCRRPACPHSCRLSSWYLSSCLFFLPSHFFYKIFFSLLKKVRSYNNWYSISGTDLKRLEKRKLGIPTTKTTIF